MGELMCDHSDLPVSQCGHCRERNLRLGLDSRGLYRREDLERLRHHPMFADQLRPLTPAEVQRWVAVRYGQRPDLVEWHKYLTDATYHARVELWEAGQRRTDRHYQRAITPSEAVSVLRELAQAALKDRWDGWLKIAFGPEEDWEQLSELAGEHLGLGPWMLAQWDGRCKGCGGRFWEGDSVRWSDDEGGMVCLDCGSER
jgi:hypothetical protein